MDKTKHYKLGFGGAFYVVKTPEGQSQPDFRAASKAIEVIKNKKDKPFFISLGLIRPHVPLVAPKKYFDMYPPEEMIICQDTDEDLKDIPKAGHSKTTAKFGVEDEMTRKKMISAYYASVTFMDAQVGRVLDALEEQGLRENTIIVFTSDHGWHLGEHTFWQKQNLHEESAQVPLIISTPGQQPAVSTSMTELLDLYPTLSKQCGLDVPSHVMGKDISPILINPKASVREAALCVTGKDKFMLRSQKWAFMQYGKNGEKGFELYDMKKDSGQHTNLAKRIEYKEVLEKFKKLLKKKIASF
jgi:arylsulfatase A-like enzyme